MRLPPHVPTLLTVPAQGQQEDMQSSRYPHRDGMAPHGPLQLQSILCLAHCSEMSLQRSTRATLLNLPSNTSEASSHFSRQKHLLLWATELLPALHSSG